MEQLTLSLTRETRHAGERASAEALVALSGQAYQLAARLLDSSQDAEDVVQQACIDALSHLPAGLPENQLRPWFFTIVANAAKKHRRGEVRRRKREAAVKPVEQNKGADRGEGKGESVAVLRGAMTVLEEKYRVPIALCYEQGLTQREAATVLNMPESTVSKYVNVGLARLRKALEGAGYPAAVAAVLGGLKQTAPVVPASLAGRVEALVAQSAMKTRTVTVGSAPAVARGGIAMKIVAGVLLAGAVAAGVAVLSAGGGSAPLPAEKPKKKFAIPVWHPDARWEVPKESFSNITRVPGVLDGPRREVMQFSATRPHLLGGFVGSGRYVFQSYDARTERFHPATRGARGNFDGRFSRARFSDGDYHDDHLQVRGRGGRFYYVVAGWWTGQVRVLDFATQTVSTLPVRGCAVSADGESGKVYVVNGIRPVAGVTVLSPGPEWKVLKKQPLQGNQNVNGLGFVLAVDEKRGRLYGRTAYTNQPWYVWYWDLKDGSYHGVLPLLPKGAPGARRQGEAGPFKGTKLYAHGELGWGPDDPDKRYLYVANVDDGALYRMDLDRKVLMVMNREGRFAGSGRGIMAAYSRMPLWFEDGSFVGSHGKFPGVFSTFFRRVK